MGEAVGIGVQCYTMVRVGLMSLLSRDVRIEWVLSGEELQVGGSPKARALESRRGLGQGL